MLLSTDVDRSAATDQLPLLIADLFEAAGAVRRHGERIASGAGQSQARWQLLSVLSSGGSWTVPRIARRLGITRQAVQRVADLLRDEDLVRADENPDHERSPLLTLTQSGRDALAAITHEAERWHRQLAASIGRDDAATARAVLRALTAAAAAEQTSRPVL